MIANARIRHAQFPNFSCMPSMAWFTHNLTRILAERYDLVGIEQGFEIALKDLASITHSSLSRQDGHLRNGRPVQVFAVTFAVSACNRSERLLNAVNAGVDNRGAGLVLFERHYGTPHDRGKTVAQSRNLRRTRFHSFDRSNGLFHLRIDWGPKAAHAAFCS